MTDEAAPSDRNTPPDQPRRKGRGPVTIDQEGRPERDAAATPVEPAAAETQAGDAAPAADAPAAPPAAAEAPAAASGLLAPVLGVLCFLLLAGAIGYVWYQQQTGPGGVADVQALRQQVQQTQDQLTRLAQQRQAAAPASAGQVQALDQQVGRLRQQFAQLSQQEQASIQDFAGKLAAVQQQAAPDLKGISARLDALEQRKPPDLAPLNQQIGQVQAQVQALQQQVATVAQSTQSVNALAQQVQNTANQNQQGLSAVKQQLESQQSRLSSLEQSAAQVSGLAQRATRLARLQAAQMALAQGQKLGEIQGAPPALARYADSAPPTVAALRLSYPAAEHAALQASAPDTTGQPFFNRVLAHAETLVTVRQGDRVLVGDKTAGVLARARAALDAGDLPGAVSAVSSLSGPPAKAMADWLQQAKALLAARSALAEMVAHS